MGEKIDDKKSPYLFSRAVYWDWDDGAISSGF